MPQFDISSFPVQIFWLFFLLLLLYVYISYKFLPNTLFLLKMRTKLYSKNTALAYGPISIKDVNLYKTYSY